MRRPVAVIGAGPAGLSAAAALAAHGMQAIVLDERRAPGGRRRVHQIGRDGRPDEAVGVLLAALPESLVTLHQEATVWGLFDGWRVAARVNEGTVIIEAAAVVAASGLISRIVPFPGHTIPGVMTAAAVSGLVHAHVRPGLRAAVLGDTDVGRWIGGELRLAAVEVIGPLEATQVRAEGAPRVQRLVATDAAGHEETHAVDLVVLAQGTQPLIELALQAGCRTVFDPRLGGSVPAFSSDLSTSAPGLFVAGGIIGAQTAGEATVLGRLAGTAAAVAAGAAGAGGLEPARTAAWAELEAAARTGPEADRLAAWKAIASAETAV